VVRDIAEGLNKKTETDVLVCRKKGKAQTEVYGGVRLTRAASLGVLMSMPVSPDFLLKYRKMSQKADIISIHHPFPLADLALWLFGVKKKLVIWWHSDIVRQKFMLKLLSPLIRHSLNKADLIIVATEEMISSSAFLPKHTAKCAVIPYGLDFDVYENPRGENFLTDKLFSADSKKLLFAGRLVYYKGIDILLKAMAGIEGAELFVAGDGKLRDELIGQAGALGMREKIHFLGKLSDGDLRRAYSDCDIFVFPSCENSEAFGISQLEAMFYGKPVINTNLPTGVPTVSIDGVTGITVPPKDVSALREAIIKLLENDTLRKEYGKNAAKRVREHFDLKQMLSKLLSHYHGLFK